MTINFKWLKSNNDKLSNEKIIQVLMDYNKSYFSGWITYNESCNPKGSIDNYIIDLPVSMIDDINELLSVIS
jgi:hypothetical protein